MTIKLGDNKIGFYYNCYKNKYATDNVLNVLRKYYPDNNIFLMSDKGDDFNDLALKYNCVYYYSNINILGGKIINSKPFMGFANTDCMMEYLKIIKIAIDKCDSEYIIFMEDDVVINGLINFFPKHSGGDTNTNNFNNLLNDEGKIFFKQKYPNIKFNYWNLAGGSIIHSQTLLECIENINIDELLFLNKYATHPLGFCHTNDIILSFLLAINGKTNDKWTNTPNSNIKHPDKRFYNKNLGIEQGVHRK